MVSGGGAAFSLAFANPATAKHAFFYDIGKRNGRKEHMNLAAEFFPQIMRYAAGSTRRAALGAARPAPRGIDGFIDRHDDVGDTHVRGRTAEAIAATRSAHALHKTAAPQF